MLARRPARSCKRAFTGRAHGGKERWAEIRRPQIQPRCKQECQECHASAQERNTQAWQERSWRYGEEPQAGDRDRTIRGTKKGRQGAAEAQLVPQAELAQALIEQVVAPND